MSTLRKKLVTLEEVNWDDNLFGSSTTLLSKHVLQAIYISIPPTIQHSKISRNTQALGHNPVSHSSPDGEGVRNCTNSKIDKQKVLHYGESKDPCPFNFVIIFIPINYYAVFFAPLIFWYFLMSFEMSLLFSLLGTQVHC